MNYKEWKSKGATRTVNDVLSTQLNETLACHPGILSIIQL